MGYATLDDVYTLGFTARSFVIVPRAWNASYGRDGDAINISTGVIRMAGHGYSAADLVDVFLVASGGALPGGLPSGLLSPLPIDFFRFQLATSSGGSPLTFSSPGSGWGIQINPERRLQKHIDDAAARIDECLTAHQPPLQVDPISGKYPTEIVGLNARMAARSAIPTMQFENAAQRVAADVVRGMEKRDNETLDIWRSGKPIQPRPLDMTPKIPDNAAVFGRGRRDRGMDRRVL
jgi:hypothetical protein